MPVAFPVSNGMNPRYSISLFVIILIAVIGGVVYANKDRSEDAVEENQDNEVACTMDARECPDGSFVGRIPPNCEFATCPRTSPTSTAPTVAATVRYTENGFEPKSITIKKGETVRFLNESDRDMWVGSAMHPTHSVYPEKTEDDCLGSSFDQCKAESKGSVFDFAFREVGTWGYHNHMQAGHFGSVTVTEN